MIFQILRGLHRFQTELPDEISMIYEGLKNGQNPDTFMLTCVDSRVMPELLTNGKPGELLMHRNVGNMMPAYHPFYDNVDQPFLPPSEIATLQFAIVNLKVKNIIICGHSDCGAMKTLLQPNPKLNWVNHWVYAQACTNPADLKLHDVGSDSPLVKITKQNIVAQLKNLTTYSFVQEKVQQGELTLHGMYFDFDLKKVLVYEPSCQDFVSLQHALDYSIEKRKEKIIHSVAINYIETLPLPQDASEYHVRRTLIIQLSTNLQPIWAKIQAALLTALWAELEDLYPDQEAEPFKLLIDQAVNTKLYPEEIKFLLSKLTVSRGYYKHCHSSHSLLPPLSLNPSNAETFGNDITPSARK